MTELFEKSIHTLELPRVLERLANEAVTEEGKERCLTLRPSVDLWQVGKWLDETTAAFQMLVLKGSPTFSGVRPVAAALQRANRGGSLNTRELLDIAAVLRTARTAREYGMGQSNQNTPLDHLFTSLTPNRFLEDKITTCIVAEDEIADSASPELASIRRHIRACSAKVREVLNKLISSSQSKFLQESIITMRSGRYVVPVKSEYKNEIAGLVHDVSGTGSTFFVEPMGVVNANNELRELQAKEEKEIERILDELSADSASFQEDIAQNYDLLIFLDVIFAKAKLSSRMGALAPKLGDYIELNRARHPLLDPKTAVANDLRLGNDFDTLMITGPNTGGKTVTLKTIGLLTLMAQCGLHISAADGSVVKVCSQVLADIGDEQSIDQSLSTFSSHMKNIVGILEVADDNTLVLFDELGAGTDPIEGAALAASIIESTRNMGALVAATTHYSELKVYAMTTVGVENASCEFNVETLAPTYRLLIGIPGKSNAFAISKRLGLSEVIIQRATKRLDAENIRFEDVLTRLDEQRQQMELEKETAARLRRENEEYNEKIRVYKEQLEKEKDRAVERARTEAKAILDDARAVADATFKELNEMRRRQEKQQSDWQTQNDQRANLRRKLNQAKDALTEQEQNAPAPPPSRAAQVGDTVAHLRLNIQAEVASVNKDGSLVLRAGAMNLNAKQDEVRVLEDVTAQKQKAKQRQIRKTAHQFRATAAPSELDLRGMESLEAISAVDLFLDSALRGKLETVRIIHGKGTGALRKAVREHLKRSKYVSQFRSGLYGEGEDGVTVVTLK